MAARRIGTDVTQPAIQVINSRPRGGRGSHDPRIRRTGEVLVDGGVDVMPGGNEHLPGRARHVLVQLDLHSRWVSGTSSSRASNPP